MRWRTVMAALALLLPLVSACDKTMSGAPKVSSDMVDQARFEAARRTLADIRDLRRRGRVFYAECKTAEMLFYKDLKHHRAAQARALAKALKEACKGYEVHGDPGT